MSGQPELVSRQNGASDITRILQMLHAGDSAAAANLFTLVYDELRRIASRQVQGERSGHTLSPTALVHEAYLCLVGSATLGCRDRADFFGAAANAMRHILIDYARKHGRQKRGGSVKRLPLDIVDLATEDHAGEILAVDDALRRLEEVDATAAQVVRLRFYAGLSVDEVAAVWDVSPRTVAREWAHARAWLFRAMSDGTR